MIYEQYDLAKYTQDFIKRRGLKKAFIAAECGIRREDFSKWINLHYVLADNEVQRIHDWVNDYEQRLNA